MRWEEEPLWWCTRKIYVFTLPTDRLAVLSYKEMIHLMSLKVAAKSV